jgi:hypothetical protein
MIAAIREDLVLAQTWAFSDLIGGLGLHLGAPPGSTANR